MLAGTQGRPGCAPLPRGEDHRSSGEEHHCSEEEPVAQGEGSPLTRTKVTTARESAHYPGRSPNYRGKRPGVCALPQ